MVPVDWPNGLHRLRQCISLFWQRTRMHTCKRMPALTACDVAYPRRGLWSLITGQMVCIA
eukprot:1158338-Pelagomonas_calceolata.AAC.1